MSLGLAGDLLPTPSVCWKLAVVRCAGEFQTFDPFRAIYDCRCVLGELGVNTIKALYDLPRYPIKPAPYALQGFLVAS